MAIIKSEHLSITLLLVTIFYLVPFAFSNDANPIPSSPAELKGWFKQNVQPLSARKTSIDPALVTAEANRKIIKVSRNGAAQFKSVTDAVNSIPSGNTNRYIISIAPGTYNEKIMIKRDKKFITLYGEDPVNKPVLVFGGTGAKYGTFYSATLTVEGDYFSAVNIRFENSAPRPPPGAKGAQAVAMRIGGDKASFYSCMFIGFQDTLCDDNGRHFFKDCLIEGTIDFIFGAGRSLYVNCDIHIIPGDVIAVITAQGAQAKLVTSGYSFVHCKVSGGKAGTGLLGRAWRSYPQVVFSYSLMSNAVSKLGWSDNQNPANAKTVFYGEFQNTGPMADLKERASYMKKFNDQQAKPFISLSYILGSTWLLPPTKLGGGKHKST